MRHPVRTGFTQAIKRQRRNERKTSSGSRGVLHRARLQPAGMQHNTPRARLRRLVQRKFRADAVVFASATACR
ncbi:hypothetical protein BZM27_21475 [Paraburkholderia steynii]|uniref:Uncharacterized protein n=1 Tax=Paraburkholderia steynii TaxID=1245441 RepID=A0A4R0XEE0_9BURK|nr:hypothetical protein BZM27_21475 [Paraburkholderia steynii]